MADASQSPGSAPYAAQRPKKRAVLLIHGMGNQAPMETLRGFVDAVWTTNESVGGEQRREIWSKPDIVGGTRELRRITTRADADGVRTDFFELYWAHLVRDTQLSSVVWWLRHLLLRGPSRVPGNVRWRWVLGLIAIALLVLAAAAMLWSALALVNPRQFAGQLPFVVPLAAGLGLAGGLWFIRHRVLIEVVGDAARYLTPSPENISARSDIRELGLKVIKAFHEGGEYERIVVVGHSLGSVIGYDILGFYWADICKSLVHSTPDERKALIGIQRSAATLHDLDVATDQSDSAEVRAHRVEQRRYAATLAGMANPKWLITDFVTLGSPLTHAHFLLVDDSKAPFKAEIDRAARGWFGKRFEIGRPLREVSNLNRVARLFAARASQREFPISPPQTEFHQAFSYHYRTAQAEGMIPHHAAPFAPARWTNIYVPFRPLFKGDPVGGRVAPIFGPGVKDVPLTGPIARKRFAHTSYWSPSIDGDTRHLEALRDALDLAHRQATGRQPASRPEDDRDSG